MNYLPVALQVAKQAQKYSFIRYILSDQVWWCNVKQFSKACKAVIPKILTSNLCKSIGDMINYSTFISPFESGKCEKQGKNYKNLIISRLERAI